MTSSPAARAVTPGPVSATTPARSLPWPDGNVAGHLACSRPSRILASPGLIPAALTCTSTWLGPGAGFGTSTTFRTSTPPYSSNRTAFISLPPSSLKNPSTPGRRRVCPPGGDALPPLPHSRISGRPDLAAGLSRPSLCDSATLLSARGSLTRRRARSPFCPFRIHDQLVVDVNPLFPAGSGPRQGGQ